MFVWAIANCSIYFICVYCVQIQRTKHNILVFVVPILLLFLCSWLRCMVAIHCKYLYVSFCHCHYCRFMCMLHGIYTMQLLMIFYIYVYKVWWKNSCRVSVSKTFFFIHFRCLFLSHLIIFLVRKKLSWTAFHSSLCARTCLTIKASVPFAKIKIVVVFNPHFAYIIKNGNSNFINVLVVNAILIIPKINCNTKKSNEKNWP